MFLSSCLFLRLSLFWGCQHFCGHQHFWKWGSVDSKGIPWCMPQDDFFYVKSSFGFLLSITLYLGWTTIINQLSTLTNQFNISEFIKMLQQWTHIGIYVKWMKIFNYSSIKFWSLCSRVKLVLITRLKLKVFSLERL